MKIAARKTLTLPGPPSPRRAEHRSHFSRQMRYAFRRRSLRSPSPPPAPSPLRGEGEPEFFGIYCLEPLRLPLAPEGRGGRGVRACVMLAALEIPASTRDPMNAQPAGQREGWGG